MTNEALDAQIDRPAARKDIVVSKISEGGGYVYVLKDPIAARYFRMREAEYQIFALCDGARDFGEIRAEYFRICGILPPEKGLRTYIARLRAVALIRYPHWETPPLSRPKQSILGRILYLRLSAINPDRFLEGLHRLIRPIFSPYFVALVAVIITHALWLTFTRHKELTRAMETSFNAHQVALFWIISCLIAILHETAHGITCKHWGGEVREIGALLIYFNFALYCNVSDSWLFREKRKKLWVMFSGGFFEMFLWALGMEVWRNAAAGSMISTIALIVIAVSGVKNILNFIPLIKLDGYYLLSDALELPNLRSRSFAFVGKLIRGRSGIESIPIRERVIYTIFACLAGPFSVLLLGSIALGLFRVIAVHSKNMAIVVSLLLGSLVLLDFFSTHIRRPKEALHEAEV